MTKQLVEQEKKVKLGEYHQRSVNNIFKLWLSMRAIPIALMSNSSSEEGKTWVIKIFEIRLTWQSLHQFCVAQRQVGFVLLMRFIDLIRYCQHKLQSQPKTELI
jgi:hypothetical protein